MLRPMEVFDLIPEARAEDEAASMARVTRRKPFIERPVRIRVRRHRPATTHRSAR